MGSHNRCCKYIVALIFVAVLGIVLIAVFLTTRKSDNNSTTDPMNTGTTISTTIVSTTEIELQCGTHSCVQTAVNPFDHLTTFWSFDSNALDQFNLSNAVTINNPYYLNGYAGNGQCVLFNGIDQYAVAPFIPLNNRSFTIEMFIFLNIFPTDGLIILLSQCSTTSAPVRQCLTLGLNHSRLFFSFSEDQQFGTTYLTFNQWYHLAFVFDAVTLNRKIYLDGQLISGQIVTSVYLGTSGNTNIGSSGGVSASNLFPGYVDNLAIYTNRVKSACEIMNDATLVSYFSSDNGSLTDSTLNQMQASVSGDVQSVPGYLNGGVAFPLAPSYLSISGYSMLGFEDLSFSTSIWIKPSQWSGTIVHISYIDFGGGYCLPILGLTSSGIPSTVIFDTPGSKSIVLPITGGVPLNQWTHLVQTFSPDSGLRLYVNGTLVGYTNARTFYGAAKNMYLFLGSYGSGGGECDAGAITPGQFYGVVDEFRVFSRALTQSDVCALRDAQ